MILQKFRDFALKIPKSSHHTWQEMKMMCPGTDSPVTVKKHHELQKFTEQEIRERGVEILKNADHGVQTTVVGADGAVRAVIGLNGIRYFPDPDPDPLDEVILLALDSARKENK